MQKSRIILLLFILTFGIVADSEAQTKVFSEAKGVAAIGKYYDFEKWEFLIGGDKYEITNKGQGKRTDGRNRVTKFRLSLEGAETLEGVYFAEYKNDLLLMSGLDFGGEAAGFIVRLDGKTLKVVWRKHIPAFNIARGLVENGFAYLAAIGFAAKINLDTGKYIWKHEDFYRKYKESGAFNIFEVPKIEGSTIIYTENDIYSGQPNIIKFNKNTGKVIEVKVN